MVATLALASAIGLFHATAAHAQSLTSVVRKTLDTNPELQALVFNRRAIDQELEAAKGLGLPSIDSRVSAGHRTTDQSLTARGLGLGEGYRSRNRLEAGVTVTQRLFDGFDRENQVARQGNRVESARHRVLDTANSVALQAVQAHLEVLRSQRVLGVASKNVKDHQSILTKVRDRAGSGRSPQSEVNQAAARFQGAKAAEVEAQGRA
ncbi:MAG: TolC family protein, partial [Bosea sp. (in: a-proteobacteria)]